MNPARSRDPQDGEFTSFNRTGPVAETEKGGASAETREEVAVDVMEMRPIQEGDDEASRLRDLATDVRDQDDLERDIGRQV